MEGVEIRYDNAGNANRVKTGFLLILLVIYLCGKIHGW